LCRSAADPSDIVVARAVLHLAAVQARSLGVCAISLAILWGCRGWVDDLGPSGEHGGPSDPSDPPGMEMPALPMDETEPAGFPDIGVIDRCDPAAPPISRAPSVAKLTKRELLLTLKALFSEHRFFPLDELSPFRDLRYVSLDAREPMQVALNDYPDDFSYVAGEDFERVFSRDQLAAWIGVADALATDFVDNGWVEVYWDEGCEVTARACREAFVANLGRRAFRRPLSIEEVGAFVSAMDGLAGDEAIHRTVSRFLTSPHFMYRMESARAGGDRVRLTDHEVASRLSYALADRPPDAELAAAADAGALATLDQVRAHAERLVRSDEAKDTLMEFFASWLLFGKMHNPPGGWGNFMMLPDTILPDADLYNTERWVEEFREEAEDFIRYVVWEIEGDFHDLMTLAIAFPRTERAQIVYRADGHGDGMRSAPQNPGVLTRAGLLASGGMNPNAILRGVFLRKRILCQDIPPPDFSVVATRQADLDALDPVTTANHEIVSQVTSPATCTACHQHINPIGFLFEAYNPLGMRDSVQRVPVQPWDFPRYGQPEPGGLPAGVTWLEISTFELPGPQAVAIDGTPRPFADPSALIDAIAESRDARSCMTVRLFRYLNRRSETDADACALAGAAASMESETLLGAFVDTLVNDDIFWRRP
jgi:hypothetical protein